MQSSESSKEIGTYFDFIDLNISHSETEHIHLLMRPDNLSRN